MILASIVNLITGKSKKLVMLKMQRVRVQLFYLLLESTPYNERGYFQHILSFAHQSHVLQVAT